MNNPLISVITVSYNAASTIEQTILSVINQTYSNIEYIIIDGGSTDGTVDIIKKYADKITYWVSEPDKGIYDAMNKGIVAATGEWINFMNSGDRFYSDNVLNSVFARIIKCNDADIIYGDRIAEFSFASFYQKPNMLSGMTSSFPIFHQATFVLRKLSNQNLFNTSYSISADYDFFYKMYLKKKQFVYMNIPIAICEIGSGISTFRQNNLKRLTEDEYIKKGRIGFCAHLILVVIEKMRLYIRCVIMFVHPDFFSPKRRIERILKNDKFKLIE
ncbi:glycosyltransferase family 2 protein [Phocaeicola sp.]